MRPITAILLAILLWVMSMNIGCDDTNHRNLILEPSEEQVKPVLFVVKATQPVTMVVGQVTSIYALDLFQSQDTLAISVESQHNKVATAELKSGRINIAAIGEGVTKINVSAKSRRSSGASTITVIVIDAD